MRAKVLLSFYHLERMVFMQYLVTFLEGLVSFLSPCMLPLLPVYISYFAGGTAGESGKPGKKGLVFLRALAFVLGFTTLFCLMGLFAGTLGTFLARYQKGVNLVCGILVILFGLNYMEVIRLPGLAGRQAMPQRAFAAKKGISALVSAYLFGTVYALTLTPCIGTFLGAALLLASAAGTALQGTLLLLVYALGMGLPFLLSALLLGELRAAFEFVKKNYSIVNKLCGTFLILVGAAMMLGLFEKLMALLK